MVSNSLLPPNATAQEVAIEGSTSRISDIPVSIRSLWNADTCDESLLPWLAWAFGCNTWDEAWTDEHKRATIKDAISIQRRKGSIWSIRQVLLNAGYGDISIVEGLYGRTHDGSAVYNGFVTYGDPTEWAKYRIVLNRPISNKQAAQVRTLLENTAPARCHLIEFVYTTANNLYDGTITHNGTYNHGTA